MAINRFCKNCGKELVPGSRFCRFCGTAQGLEGFGDEPETSAVPPEIQAILEEEKAKRGAVKPEEKKEVKKSENSEGKEIQPGADVQKPSAPQRYSTIRVPVSRLIAGVIAVAVVAGIFIWANKAARKPIDINKIVEISVDQKQYSGNASAKVDVDYDLLTEEIGKENIRNCIRKMMRGTGSTEAEIDAAEKTGLIRYDASELFSFIPDNTYNLQNGDTVAVKAEPGLLWSTTFALMGEEIDFESLCKELKIRMSDTVKYTVSGLPEVTMISLCLENPAQYIRFSGVDGEGTAVLELPESYVIDDRYYLNKASNASYQVVVDNQEIGYLYYTLENKTKNQESQDVLNHIGETDDVVLKTTDARVSDYITSHDAGVLKADEIKIPVPELSRYIEDLDTLSQEDLGTLADIAVSRTYSPRDIDTMLVLGVYKLKLKPNEVASGGKTNKGIGFIVRKGEGLGELIVRNIMRNADGSIDTRSVEDYFHYSAKVLNDEMLKEFFRQYEIEKLNVKLSLSGAKPAEPDGKSDNKDGDSRDTAAGEDQKTVTVITDKLRIRAKPNTESEIVGHAEKNRTYEILDIVQGGDYTWYKIGEDQYIASREGDWTRMN